MVYLEVWVEIILNIIKIRGKGTLNHLKGQAKEMDLEHCAEYFSQT